MAISDKDFYEVKADVQSNTKDIVDLKGRMGDVEKKQELLYEMNSNIALMAQSLKRVEGDVGEMKVEQREVAQKVTALENAPAQETLSNINKVKIAAITAVVTLIASGITGAIIAALNK